MGTPYLAEIRIMSFGFAPRGWAQCNGQFLPINQNQALFSLLGTMYGGNGQTNFALPNLQGRVPIHKGAAHTQGEAGGELSHTLSVSEIPTHNHAMVASSGDSSNGVTAGVNNFWGDTNDNSTLFSTGTPNTAMNAGTVTNTGGNQAHENMQPYTALNFCIALQGIFPSQS